MTPLGLSFSEAKTKLAEAQRFKGGMYHMNNFVCKHTRTNTLCCLLTTFYYWTVEKKSNTVLLHPANAEWSVFVFCSPANVVRGGVPLAPLLRAHPDPLYFRNLPHVQCQQFAYNAIECQTEGRRERGKEGKREGSEREETLHLIIFAAANPTVSCNKCEKKFSWATPIALESSPKKEGAEKHTWIQNSKKNGRRGLQRQHRQRHT